MARNKEAPTTGVMTSAPRRRKPRETAEDRKIRTAPKMAGMDLMIGETISRLFNDEFESEFALEAAGAQMATRALIQEVANGGPIMAYLDVARKDAVTAIEALADVDPADVGEVSSIKADVRKYVELVSWMSSTVGAVRQHGELEDTEERDPEPVEPVEEPGGPNGERDFAD